jgi:membrane associated rhomboid family serine protease
MPRLPPVTQALIIANVVVFLLRWVIPPGVFDLFALWPLGSGGFEAGPGFQVWQVVTYSFLHGSVAHLFFNMLALFMFGSEIERVYGQRRYATFYFVCVICAALAQLVVSALRDVPPYPTVGASGGVFGLLLAFGMMFPRRMIMLIFPPIPMPAWLFVTLYGVLELFLGVTGTQPGVAHFAHLGGMLGGYLLILYWRGRLPFGQRRR